MYVYPTPTSKTEHNQIKPLNPTTIFYQIQKAEKRISDASGVQQ